MPADHVMSQDEIAAAELSALRQTHRDLDARIAGLAAEGPAVCSLTLGRLKREKLVLKDRIARLQDMLLSLIHI